MTITWIILPLIKEIFVEGDGIDVAVGDALVFCLLLLIFIFSLSCTIYLAYDTTNAVPTDVLVLK